MYALPELTVRDAQAAAYRSLLDRSDTPRLDAEVLLAHVLGVNRAWVLAHPEAGLSPPQELEFYRGVERLHAGEPLAYLLGRWEFYGLEFWVNPHTLIPRPETELLVEAALDWLRSGPSRPRAIDVGTGSGCIAVSLACHHPTLHIYAVDVNPGALQVARRNAGRHRVARRVHCLQADLIAPFWGTCDLICANLPYIPSAGLQALRVARHEPRLALDGGPDGLRVIRRLLEQAPARLAVPGLLLLEIESTQGPAVVNLAANAFPHARVDLLADLAGHDRLVVVKTG